MLAWEERGVYNNMNKKLLIICLIIVFVILGFWLTKNQNQTILPTPSPTPINVNSLPDLSQDPHPNAPTNVIFTTNTSFTPPVGLPIYKVNKSPWQPDLVGQKIADFYRAGKPNTVQTTKGQMSFWNSTNLSISVSQDKNLYVAFNNSIPVAKPIDEAGVSSFVKSFFNDFGLQYLDNYLQNPEKSTVDAPNKSIQTNNSTDISGYYYDMQVNNQYVLYQDLVPVSLIQILVDSVGIKSIRLKSLYVLGGVLGNGTTISSGQAVEALNANKGRLVAFKKTGETNFESNSPPVFSSVVVDGFTIIYTIINGDTAIPSYSIHGIASDNQGGTFDVNYFIPATTGGYLITPSP
jgi:hypothetical protein